MEPFGKTDETYRELERLDPLGKVILVRNVSTGMLCVKKILPPHSEDVYRTLMSMNLPGIPQIYECRDYYNALVVIEEYVNGTTLRQYMNTNGLLPEKQARRITREICEILKRLHNLSPAIVCRDLKPDNIILRDGHPVIVDFDSGKIVRKEKNDTVLLGTPGYAAPEQFGFAASDARTDIYAVGVILNEMLTGHIPKEQLVTGSCRGIVTKCTGLDPETRPGNITEVQAMLRHSQWLPPGFRSGRPLNMIIGSIGYIANGIFIAYQIETCVVSDYFNVSMIFLWCIWSAWTIAFVFDYMGIRTKITFLNDIQDSDSRAIASFVTWIVGTILIFFGVACIYSLFKK